MYSMLSKQFYRNTSIYQCNRIIIIKGKGNEQCTVKCPPILHHFLRPKNKYIYIKIAPENRNIVRAQTP